MKPFNYEQLEIALFQATQRSSIQNSITLLQKAEDVILNRQDPTELERELQAIASNKNKAFQIERLAA